MKIAFIIFCHPHSPSRPEPHLTSSPPFITSCGSERGFTDWITPTFLIGPDIHVRVLHAAYPRSFLNIYGKQCCHVVGVDYRVACLQAPGRGNVEIWTPAGAVSFARALIKDR
ncbi:hypothetical protein AVEN_42689-1 [Araneus ventricosus]|uniref:Uncharacterized protein n=1 Tax=Araneus ventricosus TaxID=182803 RepID=A0A4Y2BLX6_ARAVE|nr:hypothetical protein AVEN_42689-1 [Araneus ventricosus]